MDPTGKTSAKRRVVAGVAVETALFGVVFLPGRPEDLCRVSPTCRPLGGGQRPQRPVLSRGRGEAAVRAEFRRVGEVAPARSYDGGGWIELRRHLPMIRSRLAFDRPVGNYIRHGDDESPVFHSAFCLIWTGGPCQFMRMDED